METTTHIETLFKSWDIEWLRLEQSSIDQILTTCPADYDNEKFDVKRLKRLKFNVEDKINQLLKK